MVETPDRTESIFAAIALATAPERVALLDRECAGDQALRSRVEALLRAHDRAGHLLDRPVPGSPEQTVGYIPREQPGTIIAGRYKLLEAIGEGGMGTVWVAEQTQPVRRKVALKLIKTGMDSKSVLARFEAERQALAVMDHPNIAKVLDGGLTETGRPFFVMEYVKGVPITEYCDATRMSVSDRLNLFVQVCSAVQHAHQKGIIHRDLKPSNILVAPYDDKPVPKVIDFGLAKAMHHSLTERTLHTAHETVLGTPLYMSPEQAQLNNLDVDTRSDIYSLGVLLYELLTGTTPLEKKRFKEAAWDEIKRLIREEEPPRPSTRLSSSHTLASLATGRQIEPAKLTKLVRGELDWIVMKSLEKDRTRRYETANGLAADIQRHLAGEPVLAAPPSARYRLGKLARKHRTALTTAAAITLLLVAGVAVSSWFAYVAVDEAKTARTAEAHAEKEAKAARKAEADAKTAEALAKNEAKRAEAEKKIAKWNERLWKDFAHAIKLDLALRAGEKSDWERMRQLLAETHADYGQTLENRLVTALWVKHAFSLKNLIGHTSGVTSVAFSPDGKRILTGSWDGTARVWDADTGTQKLTLKGHTREVTSVAFSPDGKRILTGSRDQTARVWDADTGTEKLVRKGHTYGVYSVAFSPDGKRIVTGSRDQTARVWDADTGTEKLVRKGHTYGVYSVAFSPDGKRIVTGCWDQTARVWDAETGTEKLVLKVHTGWVYSVAFSPDGKRIVSGSNDQTARVWDAETGTEKLTLKGHMGIVTSVAFSPDGKRIVTGSSDKTARVWDAETGTEKLALKGHTGWVYSVAFSPDGKRIVTGGGGRSGTSRPAQALRYFVATSPVSASSLSAPTAKNS